MKLKQEDMRVKTPKFKVGDLVQWNTGEWKTYALILDIRADEYSYILGDSLNTIEESMQDFLSGKVSFMSIGTRHNTEYVDKACTFISYRPDFLKLKKKSRFDKLKV